MVIDAELYISPQICRELLAVLTRQPVCGRMFGIDFKRFAGELSVMAVVG